MTRQFTIHCMWGKLMLWRKYLTREKSCVSASLVCNKELSHLTDTYWKRWVCSCKDIPSTPRPGRALSVFCPAEENKRRRTGLLWLKHVDHATAMGSMQSLTAYCRKTRLEKCMCAEWTFILNVVFLFKKQVSFESNVKDSRWNTCEQTFHMGDLPFFFHF